MWRWILAAIVLLAVLLLWTRVGVWAALSREGTLRLDVRFGVFRVRVLPPKPKKSPRAKRAPGTKKAKKERPPEEEEPERGGLSFAPEDLRDALRTMLPAVGRALRRFGRGIRIKPLRLSLTLAGREDPASAAETYGGIQAAVWAGMPVLEKLMDIRDLSLHTDVDFLAEDAAVDGEVGVTLRIGTLLAVGCGVAFPALGWFMRWQKRCKARPPRPGKRKGRPKAPPPEEPPTENPAA